MLYAVASLPSFNISPANREVWESIQRVFSKAGLPLTGLPHFSWHVATAYDLDGLGRALETYSRTLSPFSLHVVGIGVFSGENPVIYLPVTRTSQLSAVHAQVYQLVDAFDNQPNPYYAPDQWIPHITLLEGGFDADAICQVLKELAFLPLNLDLVIRQFAMIYRDETTSGVRSRYLFGGGIP